MTEAEWEGCRDPLPMLAFVEGKASDRKGRLFSCGCCRHVWDRLLADWCREAVEVNERLADGQAEPHELHLIPPGAERSAGRITRLLTGWVFPRSLPREVAWETSRLGVRKKERLFQAALLRCLLGNPFRPAPFDPAWRTPLVASLAESAYAERHLPSGELDPQRLAVLADALEEAGAEGELLAHLRSAGPHVRGCFGVDLALGRE